MKYYAVISKIIDVEKNGQYRQDHLDYLTKIGEKGKIFAKGKFTDGTGGLVIYKAESFEEVQLLVEKDPFISQGARTYEIHEWEMKRVNS
jgi:uncharacterized protein